MQTQLYINGEWRDGAAKDRFDVVNPATEEIFTTAALPAARRWGAAALVIWKQPTRLVE